MCERVVNRSCLDCSHYIRGQTTVKLPAVLHVEPRISHLTDFSDFICQEATVFSQQGWNVRTVTPLAVRYCRMKQILRRVGILVVTFPKHR